jgi:hypothetical protein
VISRSAKPLRRVETILESCIPREKRRQNMAKVEIKHRFSGQMLWSGEAASLGEAVIAAVRGGASLDGASLVGASLVDASLDGAILARANLDGANLDGANLVDANLVDASLDGANLARASLARANLARAILVDASLDGASLDGANLDSANLARASLVDTSLDRANLDGANLVDANLTRASLDGASLAKLEQARLRRSRMSRAERAADFRRRFPDIPYVERLDSKILEIVESERGALNMLDVHTCETTHCRAGWAIHLAGPRGYELQKKLGWLAAGRLIYRASVGHAPDFFADNGPALEDLRKCASKEAAEASTST